MTEKLNLHSCLNNNEFFIPLVKDIRVLNWIDLIANKQLINLASFVIIFHLLKQ